jgi:hypothetical protein
LALLGAIGLGLGFDDGGWWVSPSWFSFVLGGGLMLAGAVRRVRSDRKPPDGT